eukprot:TRINITY_DN1866_c0_g1_i3.p1 TRINITY_DN1866_c0_g1~~TRINITY_DN1866_c0_g1_i3.p1  ORF type:complete len:175 (+),score=13.96 TRINITY_DN1866_c0_g1_i3:46-570(+)
MKVSMFCCGCSLHTGCLIIGALQLIGSCIITLTFTGILCSSFIQDEVDEYCSEENIKPEYEEFCNDDPILALKIFYGYYLAIGLVYLIIGSLLVHGARSKNPRLLLPWIVISGLSMVFKIIIIILYAATNGPQAFLGCFISILLILCISGYFLLVVHSYRKELRENGNQQGYKN